MRTILLFLFMGCLAVLMCLVEAGRWIISLLPKNFGDPKRFLLQENNAIKLRGVGVDGFGGGHVIIGRGDDAA